MKVGDKVTFRNFHGEDFPGKVAAYDKATGAADVTLDINKHTLRSLAKASKEPPEPFSYRNGP